MRSRMAAQTRESGLALLRSTAALFLSFQGVLIKRAPIFSRAITVQPGVNVLEAALQRLSPLRLDLAWT